MDDKVAHRACLENIVELTRSALKHCDDCGDYLLAAKVNDAHEVAMVRLREFDEE